MLSLAKSGLEHAQEAASSFRAGSNQKLNIYVASLAKFWPGCEHLLLSVDTHPADRHGLQQRAVAYRIKFRLRFGG